jgi:hypothetical protein
MSGCGFIYLLLFVVIYDRAKLIGGHRDRNTPNGCQELATRISGKFPVSRRCNVSAMQQHRSFTSLQEPPDCDARERAHPFRDRRHVKSGKTRDDQERDE